jgi:hypothetical protein
VASALVVELVAVLEVWLVQPSEKLAEGSTSLEGKPIRSTLSDLSSLWLPRLEHKHLQMEEVITYLRDCVYRYTGTRANSKLCISLPGLPARAQPDPKDVKPTCCL